MEIVAAVLLYFGGLMMLYGILAFYVEAFKKSIWWGLACVFLPVVNLIFLIVHWNVAGQPFLFQIAGGVFVAASIFAMTPV